MKWFSREEELYQEDLMIFYHGGIYMSYAVFCSYIKFFIKHLLNVYNNSGIVLGAWDKAVNNSCCFFFFFKACPHKICNLLCVG